MDNNTRTNEEEALKEEKKKNRMRKAGIVLAVLGIYAILAVVHFTFFDDRMVAFDDFVDDTEIAFAPPEVLPLETPTPTEPDADELDADEPNDEPQDEQDADDLEDEPDDEPEPDNPYVFTPPAEPPEFINTNFSQRFNRLVVTFNGERIYQAELQPFALLNEVEPAVNQLVTALLLIDAAERNNITLTDGQEYVLLQEVALYHEWFYSIDAEWDIEDDRAVLLLGVNHFVVPLMDIYAADPTGEMPPAQRWGYFFGEVLGGWRADSEIVVHMHGVGHFLEIPHTH